MRLLENMKSNLVFCLLALYIVFASCSDRTKAEVEEIKLDFQNLMVDSLLIGQAYGMLVVDSTLLIADKRADSLFYSVNLNNLTFKEVGQIGQGPREFLCFDNFYRVNSKSGFYDRRLRSSNDILFSESGVSLDKNVSYESLHYKVAPTAFGTFIGIGPYEKGLFCILDLKGKVINVVGEQPYRDETERGVPEIARAMAYQGKIATSPEGDYLVHAVYMSPIISFYKLSPKNVHLLKSHVDSYPAYKPELGDKSYASAMSKSNKLGYIDIAVTDKYVYALLSGKSTEESGLSAFMGSVICVYDWNGTLVKKFMCNAEMTTICVSADDSIIYAVGLVEDYELLKATLE